LKGIEKARYPDFLGKPGYLFVGKGIPSGELSILTPIGFPLPFSLKERFLLHL
jgi:hypothetical protein